ncbi:MAG: hypothetical protein Q8P18_20960 [Pseudomonadota bacterium]|nr:hypothetical protein [Pseudomonadota bacterium]
MTLGQPGWLEVPPNLTVTFDGDVACDGCGLLTVDGVDAGEVCLGS